MPVYLVERYLALTGPDAADAFAARLRAAVAAVRAEGIEIEWLGSVVLTAEDTCLCLFDAPSEAEVAAANRRAGVDVDRLANASILRPD